ncbi:MAG TPA: MXAN_6640 family putative metalloprotease [Candidatus Deferrimicrobium sp.]|nr:MXAN_6640 family putative metalloprotease [Candidatus Deferrimicrobium sp.]
MTRFLVHSAAVLAVAVISVRGDDTLIDQQHRIIENYLYVTGQLSPYSAQAAAATHDIDGPPVKCGMSAVADFVLNRDKLDLGQLKNLGIEVVGRPVLTLERVHYSPSGEFKIHYTVVSDDAVYRPSSDRDGDGVPDYVEDMALILDFVYRTIIDSLGYPAPPADSFYPSGGDAAYDVYVKNLGVGVFGLTYLDSAFIDGPSSSRATTFMEIENDFQEITAYRNRPLDAVRVTAAHEFFHAVQFGIDFTEGEPVKDGLVRRYWMEMSSVWMEEQIYDQVNDYYTYLPYFFNNPRVSIQRFDSETDLHPYGAGILPIFLSEKYGRDIIRSIWLRCGDMGFGPDFLIAADSVIDSLSDHLQGWPHAFRDFALWNFFTGYWAYAAPEGVGYSEKEMYPAIFDTAIIENTLYPSLVRGDLNPRRPQHNSALYMRLNYTRAIVYDTSYWACNDSVFDTSKWRCNWGSFDSTCYDSTQVDDAATEYDTIHVGWVCRDSTGVPDSAAIDTNVWDRRHVDTRLDMGIGLGDGLSDHLVPPQPWGLNVVYRLDSNSDSFAVDQLFLRYHQYPSRSWPLLQFINPRQYRSMTLIISPASYNYHAYDSASYYDLSLGWVIPESLDSSLIGDTLDIDSELVSLPAAILAPFPNPAVVREMGDAPVKFNFRVPTDTLSNYQFDSPRFTVDIFTIAGELIRSLDTTVSPHPRLKEVEFTASWDMRNDHQEKVSSGVYIAVARVYSASTKGQLLAEDKVKVAVIR